LPVNVLPGPEDPHHLDLLLDAPAAGAEVLAERLEFDRVPAHRDAEAEPPAREHVHRGRLLGHQRGLTLRKDDDARDQFHPARDRGEEPEEHERLVEAMAVGVGPLPPARALRVGAQHVVEDQDVREPHVLDGLGVRADGRRVVADLGLREHDADLHGLLLEGGVAAQRLPGTTPAGSDST
jgi:hypothetical protein